MLGKIVNKKNFFYLLWMLLALMVLRDMAHARTPFTDDMKSVNHPAPMRVADDNQPATAEETAADDAAEEDPYAGLSEAEAEAKAAQEADEADHDHHH